MIAALAALWGWLRGSWLGRAAAIALGVLVALAFAYGRGKRAQRQQHRIDDLEQSNEVRKRGAKARREHDENLRGADRDAVVDSLRKRGGLRDE